jgi:hypothetical protein
MKAQCILCKDVVETNRELVVCRCKKSYLVLTEDSFIFGGYLRRIPKEPEGE